MSDKVKGITIEIGGDTKGLDKAIKSVNGEIRSTSNELKQVERLLKLDPTNTELLAQKQTLLGKNIETVQDKLQALKKAKDKADQDMANGTEVNQNQYRRLQREIIQAEQDLNKLNEETDEGKKKIDALGASSEKLNNFMNKASVAAAGVAAGIVTLGIKAAASADDINTLSTQTGLSTEAIQIFQYASDRIDVSLDTLTGSLAKLTKNMYSAQQGSKNQKEAFAALGISIVDNNGKLRNNQEVMNEAINALAKMENETQRDAYAMQLFGKSAQVLNPLILGGADALEKMGKEAKAAGLILDDDTLQAANKFNDVIDKLKANATGAFAKVGSEIATELTPYAESAAEAVGEFGNYVLENKETILSGLTAIAAALIAYKSITTIQYTVTAFISLKDAITKAKTAQQAFNAVAGSNAIALTVTAIAALTTGLITYASTHTKTARDIQKSYEDAIEAIDKKTAADLAEAEMAIVLKNKLFDLDKQIKSGTLTQEEAAVAQKKLKVTADELKEIIPSITSSIYDETGAINVNNSAVEKLTVSYYNLAKAKAYATAYEGKLSETLSSLIEVEDALEEYENGNKQKYTVKHNRTTGETTPVYDVNYQSLLDQQKELEGKRDDYINKMTEQQQIVLDLTDEVEDKITDTNKNITNTVNSGVKDRTEKTNKAHETALKKIKEYHDFGIISDEEYYTELAKIRNDYFKEGTDDWGKYTDEIYNFYTSMLLEAKEAAYQQLKDISNAQDAMTLKLQEGVKTFRKFSIIEKGNETNFTKLADVGADNKQLEQYNNLLDRLFEKRKDLPDNLMDTLSSMGVEDGIAYVTAMLTATDEEFNNYLNQLERNEKLAEEISGKVANNEIAETAAEIQKQFSQVSEDFFKIGEDSAREYGEGFMSELDNVYKEVSGHILNMLPQLQITSDTVNDIVGAKGSSVSNNSTTNSYNNSRSTNITINNPAPVSSAYEQRVQTERMMNDLATQGVL